MNNPVFLYKDDGEVETAIRRFESCLSTPQEFDHRAHLTVALWYVCRLGAVGATERIRKRLRVFLNHHQLKGYNETITLFWVRLVCKFYENTGAKSCSADLANKLLHSCCDSKLIFNYYSKDRLLSKEAQAHWIEPDLQAFD